MIRTLIRALRRSRHPSAITRREESLRASKARAARASADRKRALAMFGRAV